MKECANEKIWLQFICEGTLMIGFHLLIIIHELKQTSQHVSDTLTSTLPCSGSIELVVIFEEKQGHEMHMHHMTHPHPLQI